MWFCEKKHIKRTRKPRTLIPEIQRFLTKVVIDEFGCWQWIGGKGRDGYARFGVWKGKTTTNQSHRWIYKYYHNEIDPKLTIDHLCRNRSCVNTKHMELVSNRINILRGTSPMAVNAQKKYCKRGHEFNEKNTLMLKTVTGVGRQCRKCAEFYRRRDGIGPRIIQTVCRNGHKKTPENMYKTRSCKICAKERQNRRNALWREKHPNYLELYSIKNKQKYEKNILKLNSNS